MSIISLLLSAALLLPSINLYAASEFSCLSEAIYFEAGDQSTEGMIGIVSVIENRVASPNFPNTICDVVFQHGQFAFTREHPHLNSLYDLKTIGKKPIENSLEVALHALQYGYGDNTKGALYFINLKVSHNKQWVKRLVHTVNIDDHSFYRERPNGLAVKTPGKDSRKNTKK
jgi:N-acetylmuramoyl-L-alanine amidase